MAAIKLPDGSVKEVADGSTVAQLAESIGKRLAQAAIVGKVDVSLARVYLGEAELLCDVLERCLAVSQYLLERAPA